MLAVIVGSVPPPAWGQNEPSTDALSKRDGEKAPLPKLDASAPDTPAIEIPPEIAKAIEEAKDHFEKSRAELASVLVEMRKTHTLYLNDEDRNKAAADNYRLLRNKARKLMNQTFDAALDLFRMQPDQRAATHLGSGQLRGLSAQRRAVQGTGGARLGARVSG